MKNYLGIAILAILAIYGWNKFSNAKKYNANDSNSLAIMTMLTTPENRVQLVKDFELASDDIRGINLHGLTAKEIHVIAEGRRESKKEHQIDFLKKVIEVLEESRKESVILNSNATRFPDSPSESEEYSISELRILLDNLSR